MKTKALLFTLLLAIPTLATADNTKAGDKGADKTTQKAPLSDDDAKVVSHVKHVNDMEIEMGKLAKTNGTASTKAYGNTLVKDHTANNTKLVALAKKKGIATIPPSEPSNDEQKLEHQKMMDGMTLISWLATGSCATDV